MREELVQWVLLRRMDYLEKCMGVPLRRKVAENFTTDYGRIDFAVESQADEIYVVELETTVDSTAKYDYCVEQVKRYKQIRFSFNRALKFSILFADNTPTRFANRLLTAGQTMSVDVKTYSLAQVQELYRTLIESLEKTAGISLGRPVAMGKCFLRFMNRLMILFLNAGQQIMTMTELRAAFPLKRTSFGLLIQMCREFDLIEEFNDGNVRWVRLTPMGLRFRDNVIQGMVTQRTAPDLSTEQVRVLLEALMNGNFTKCKVNIYYFLRFVHLTSGEWVPRSIIGKAKKYDEERLRFINHLLGTSYRWRSAVELLAFTCNQCEELGLVERIERKGGEYQQVILTSLGSRVLGYLELYLHLKREQIQIPLQIV